MMTHPAAPPLELAAALRALANRSVELEPADIT
jgi:hypothetical protein